MHNGGKPTTDGAGARALTLSIDDVSAGRQGRQEVPSEHGARKRLLSRRRLLINREWRHRGGGCRLKAQCSGTAGQHDAQRQRRAAACKCSAVLLSGLACTVHSRASAAGGPECAASHREDSLLALAAPLLCRSAPVRSAASVQGASPPHSCSPFAARRSSREAPSTAACLLLRCWLLLLVLALCARYRRGDKHCIGPGIPPAPPGLPRPPHRVLPDILSRRRQTPRISSPAPPTSKTDPGPPRHHLQRRHGPLTPATPTPARRPTRLSPRCVSVCLWPTRPAHPPSP
ncbi:hypothetical protein K505DRAFT_111115 [Melanomma pulvis-pyrius CBS 109.77]|uniref:Uncharacterized protein n=1 Tax=Melanomma pulvis-pyrius CBS 109.77 TaxID=1314802 RepID=A0A6A6XQ29_9PLEO|nr:hypothetical protein K505DRAFT_111115 [Melanomma pulvis-pyrius CBS 109.77]